MSRIGIKLDGVLIDTANFQRVYGAKFFKEQKRGKNNVQPSIQPCVSSFRAMFACTEEDCDKFWKKNYWKYCKSAECEQDAKEVIEELRNQGNEIFLVVTRKQILENGIRGKANEVLLDWWLRNNKIFCDGIIYCENDQVKQACYDFMIDIYVEDNRTDALFLSNEVCRVLLFDRPYNRGLQDNSGIECVEGFKGVYENISYTCKMKGFK